MARRRSRKQADSWGTLLVLFVFAALILAVAEELLEFVRRNQELSTLVLLALAAAGAGGGVLWWRGLVRRRELEAARAREIAVYHTMSAREFEEALAYLCRRDGCSGVRVVGGAGDLGADVIATTPQGGRLVIQAKRYRADRKVSGPDLQKFGGTCYVVHRAEVAAVVTTAFFTAQAREYAARTGIRLFCNDSLAAWASRTGPPPWS